MQSTRPLLNRHFWGGYDNVIWNADNDIARVEKASLQKSGTTGRMTESGITLSSLGKERTEEEKEIKCLYFLLDCDSGWDVSQVTRFNASNHFFILLFFFSPP